MTHRWHSTQHCSATKDAYVHQKSQSSVHHWQQDRFSYVPSLGATHYTAKESLELWILLYLELGLQVSAITPGLCDTWDPNQNPLNARQALYHGVTFPAQYQTLNRTWAMKADRSRFKYTLITWSSKKEPENLLAFTKMGLIFLSHSDLALSWELDTVIGHLPST